MGIYITKNIGDCITLYRDTNNGIAWIEDGSTGCGYSCHSNIDITGSVRGMKNLGYWKKDVRTIRSHGWIYNIDSLIVSNEWDKLLADSECHCIACYERRNTK